MLAHAPRGSATSTAAFHPALLAGLLSVAAMSGIVVGQPGGSATARRVPAILPNLLLVTLDTVRADRIGAYGYSRGSTPNLDALARGGIRFADATTSAPLTGPAHASLLTGQYPSRVGVRDNAATPLPDDAVTLAEMLAGEGYSTGAFIGAFVLDRPYGFSQGFATFESGFARVDPGREAEVQRRGDRVVDDAVTWLSARPPTPSFFAWVHLYDAHAPYDSPAPFSLDFAGRLYDGEIAFVDAQVGRLLAALRSRNQLDSTLVVTVADHGEALGDHGEAEHGLFLYDEVLRVPWIVAGPGVPAGRIVTEQVRVVDLVPTVLDLLGLDLLGLELRGHVDGESLGPLVRGGRRQDVPPSLAESFYGRLHFGASELRSLRSGSWKAIDAPRPELYDLRADPGERQDLSRKRPTIASGMIAAGSRIASGFGAVVPPTPPSPETLERLRSLGYVGTSAPAPGGRRGADPKDLVAHIEQYRRLISRALEDLRGGRAAAAATTLERLVAMNERAYDLHLFLGDAYRDLRRFDRALAEYSVAAALNPESAAPLVAAAEVHLDRRNLAAARLDADRAAQLEPDSCDVAFVGGLVLEREQRLPAALDAYQRAVALNGANPRPRSRLASLAARLGLYDIADAQLRVLLDMRYQPSRTHVGLGRIAEARKSLDEAAAHYREALRLEPGLQMALDGLQRIDRRRPPR